MKVLHAVIDGEIAGGQTVCLQIIEAFLRDGHQAVVISPSEGPFTELLRKKEIPVFLIPVQNTYSFQRAFQLARLIKREKVDLIHSHGTVPLNIISRLAAKLSGVPCISHIHAENVFNANPLVRQCQIFLDNWTTQFCYKLIAVSNATKQSLVKQGIHPDRIEVIVNSIDPNRIRCSQSREEIFRTFRIDSKKRLIGVIGRLSPTKGLEDFLKAMREITQQVPDVVGIIVGEDLEQKGKYQRELQELSRSLNLNGAVMFTGFQQDPFSFLNAMEFFVFPSLREGMPLAILEAMCLKKAVVATHVGGIPEVVQKGETGVLIPPADSGALAQAVLKLLDDPERTKEMGEAGYKRVKEYFSESRMIDQIRELYQTAVGTRSILN